MGCCIHFHIEVKIDDRWEHYATPNVWRNYALFSLLVNVRNVEPDHRDYVEPLSQPKGLPNDISAITRIAYKDYEGDAHSASWLSGDEIIKVAKEIPKLHGRNLTHQRDLEEVLGTHLFENSFSEFCNKERDDFPPELQDVRFVFWFDN